MHGGVGLGVLTYEEKPGCKDRFAGLGKFDTLAWLPDSHLEMVED